MKSTKLNLTKLFEEIPKDERVQTKLSFEISNRIVSLMTHRGLTKSQFAAAIGCRPNEVTRWLSGEHNFTIRTIAAISAFFGAPIITVNNQ